MDNKLEDLPPISKEALEKDWPIFVEEIYSRLINGAATYGDSSFTRPVHELFGEIEQELLDVVGWSFIKWRRMKELKAKMLEQVKVLEVRQS